METNTVEYGDLIRMHYKGTLDDGTVFDCTDGEEPLVFQAGIGMIIQGLDQAVIGMKIGEGKELTIKPAMAYGERDEGLLQLFQKDFFDDVEGLQVGESVMLSTKNGEEVPATVTTINADKSVMLDFNHPLAGKALTFKFTIDGITKKEMLESDCGCGCDHSHEGHAHEKSSCGDDECGGGCCG